MHPGVELCPLKVTLSQEHIFCSQKKKKKVSLGQLYDPRAQTRENSGQYRCPGARPTSKSLPPWFSKEGPALSCPGSFPAPGLSRHPRHHCKPRPPQTQQVPGQLPLLSIIWVPAKALHYRISGRKPYFSDVPTTKSRGQTEEAHFNTVIFQVSD